LFHTSAYPDIFFSSIGNFFLPKGEIAAIEKKIHARSTRSLFMQKVINELFVLLKSHSAVAAYLQYSVRQYQNIRQMVARGQALNPRIERWILASYNSLKKESVE
jgi:hypothetical protein